MFDPRQAEIVRAFVSQNFEDRTGFSQLIYLHLICRKAYPNIFGYLFYIQYMPLKPKLELQERSFKAAVKAGFIEIWNFPCMSQIEGDIEIVIAEATYQVGKLLKHTEYEV